MQTPSIEALKREAKKMSKSPAQGSYMQCLEKLAKKHGFATYAALRAHVSGEPK
jgi:hypothetical protein